MNLEVLKGLWLTNSFWQNVVVALVIETPHSFWTGAVDGRIVRWILDSAALSSAVEVVPAAVLCGHISYIVGLLECGNNENASSVFSVSTDGVLCLWDSTTGRCVRKRELPLVTTPTTVTTITAISSSNNVCIGYVCSKYDASTNDPDPNLNVKGGILIVDTMTLTVMRDVYQWELGTWALKDMVAVGEELEFKLFAADILGKVQVWSISQQEINSCARLEEGSRSCIAVSLSPDGCFLLLVHSSGWLLKEVQGSDIARDSRHGCAGGYFLRDVPVPGQQFLVWNTDGSALVYTLAKTSENCFSVGAAGHVSPVEQRGQKPAFCSKAGLSFRFEFDEQGMQVTVWPSTLNAATRFHIEEAKTLRTCFAGTDDLITSSMVLTRGSDIPLALVSGYASGDIVLLEAYPQQWLASPLRLQRHTDAVVSLALHDSQARQQLLLLSGSEDGSICVWDLLEGGKLRAVLHQHVAPVKHFVLPSLETRTPWDQCFVSVGDDGCVALSSLQTLRVERLFPGHLGIVKEVVWDEARAYLAVLCSQSERELLFIWDVHTGARERLLRGPAAQSMLKHFLGNKKGNASTDPGIQMLDSISSRPCVEKSPLIKAGCPFPGLVSCHFNISELLTAENSDLYVLKMTIAWLHSWGVNKELDVLISRELEIAEPKHHHVGAGVPGNKGAETLMLPSAAEATAKFWTSSPEYFSLHVLAMVSTAHKVVMILKRDPSICSTMALSCVKSNVCPAIVEVCAYFWQDPVECIRIAARLLFHAAAARGVPSIIRPDSQLDLTDWLESTDLQPWASSYQDVRAARIIMSGALVVWHGAFVREDAAETVAPLLLNLVRTGDKHSVTAAEILSAGLVATWAKHILSDASQLICDILHFIGPAANASTGAFSELLSALAVADMVGYMNALHLIISTSPGPSFIFGFTALKKVIRDSPLLLVPFLAQIIALALIALNQKVSIPIVTDVIREMVNAFPMVVLYPSSEASTSKLAVGDPVGDIRSLAIRVYDLNSATVVRVLDASGPPGHPALSTGRTSHHTPGISALSFTPDGQGLIAFSHQGLIIRWWSLGEAWWEKLSRSGTPAQCTKLVLVPPSPGFSPKSASSSMMASLTDEAQPDQNEDAKVDLSFRFRWESDICVTLVRGCDDVGKFQSLGF